MIAVIISFIIWIDIDITVFKKVKKGEYKAKSEKFKEKARNLGNCVDGRLISSLYNPATRNDDGTYNLRSYVATYEYIVNGKKYKKRVVYENSNYPSSQNIYYKAGNPRKAFAETEKKYGITYIMALFCIPLSIFIGMPLSAILISKIMNIF